MLVAAWQKYPCELRADLQRFYSIDIDHAMSGAHTAEHIAALVACFPTDALTYRAANSDASWTRDQIILAELRNMLARFIWGFGDPKKRGPEPKPIGPSWMTEERMKALDSRTMTIDELKAELSKPRTNKKGVNNG